MRPGLLGLRLRLTGLRDCLGADHIFGAAERQEIAELRRIDHRLRVETNQLAVVQSQAEHGRDASSVRADADRFHPAVNRHGRRKHLFDHAKRHPWFESEPRDPAVAGIQPAVVAADRVAECVIAAGPAEILDVLVLVQCCDALRSHLAAEPVGFLDEHHAAPAPRRRERGRDAAGAAAGDQDFAGHIAHRFVSGDRHHGDAHDVDYFIMVFGSHSAICGNATTSPSAVTCRPM